MNYADSSASHEQRATLALKAIHARVWRKLKPPPRIGGDHWAVKYRVLSNEESALRGRFSWDVSPALRARV